MQEKHVSWLDDFTYAVRIQTDDNFGVDFSVIAGDHLDARQKALAQYVERGYPTTAHMLCRVIGVCRDGDCCGDYHSKVCDIYYLTPNTPVS